MSDPLVPTDCELRDFPFMPIDIARLFGSEFHARASDSAWRAGVTLWLKSWHQVPAGSLPKDDVDLCRLAELGRDLRTWNKIKSEALHGWNECSDGRLYHRVVAEKVLEAWIEKLLQRKSSGSGNAKRWGIEFDAVAIDTAIRIAAGMLDSLNPQSRTLKNKALRTAIGTPAAIPPGQESDPGGNPGGIDLPQENDPKRQGRDREGKESHTPSPLPTKNQDSKNHQISAGNGSGNGAHSVTIEDPNDRMARFQAKLARQLGPDGWPIVIAATQSSSPEHKRSLALCQQAARALGKGWPKAWPIA